MTKNEFLQQLNASLKRLSEKERADILKDYEEHFTFGLEEGKGRRNCSFIRFSSSNRQRVISRLSY